MDRHQMKRVLAALNTAKRSVQEATGYPRKTVRAKPDTLFAIGNALGALDRAADMVAQEMAGESDDG
jgi:hypothetical protein